MNKKGFTLIELLIVVAIIGIVAAIAIPNLLTAIQKSKQKSTMGDMKTIGTACESYMTDNYLAPTELTDAGFGSTLAFHIKKLPARDGWGGAWGYERHNTDLEVYSIGSGGKDNSDPTAGWAELGEYQVTSLRHFEYDIVYSNGNFVYGPRVK